ncbi:MAG: ATP synthase F1 subunit epsilon [Roseibacillus sp.]|nr:ATP synthase F1 subunit epsilon [Roseibacillus sp.]
MPELLEIVTPERKVFSGEVENVYLPGSEGELGALPGHAPLVTGVSPGELRYKVDGKIEELAIGSGFAEVTQEKITILADLAVSDSEIDEKKVEEAMKRAEESLAKIDSSDNAEEVAAIQASISKSMAQLNLKRKRRRV